MNDDVNDDANDIFGTTLTLLLDDVAATINPRGDFEAAREGHVALAPTGTRLGSGGDPHRFRRAATVAAAAALLVGVSAAAYSVADDDDGALATTDVTALDSTVTPTTIADDGDRDDAEDGAVEPISPLEGSKPDRTDRGADTAPIARTAQLAGVDVSTGTALLSVLGTAPKGETATVTTPFGAGTAVAGENGAWSAVITLAGAGPGDTTARVTFSGGADVVEFVVTVPAPATIAPPPVTEPKPAPVTEPPKSEQPKPEPEQPAHEFTATLGWTDGDGTPLLVGLWGKAAPGSSVSATSSAGSGSTSANSEGTWEMVVELREVAPGAKVGIRLTSSTSSKVHELTAKAPSAVPQPKEFTAQLGSGDLGAVPMKQTFFGTGTTGSVVHAESAYGSAEAVVNQEGGWELRLKMNDVPAGTTVLVSVSNSASTTVRQFELVRPSAPPPVAEFTANAAFTECNATPPYNEYWGTGAAGATITISSPYGSGQAVVGSDGKWAARVEFPTAPVGQQFDVTVSSSQGGSVSFPFVRTPA